MTTASRRNGFVLALACALTALSAGSALAAPADLDAAFGGDGKVIVQFRRGGGANAVAIQADGKIVMAGRIGGNANPASDAKFALARLNHDGTLDATFGGDGKVTTNFTPGSDFANGIAIQRDGKIVAAGRAGGSHGRFGLVRYKPNGTLDHTFGGNGRVFTNFTPGDDTAKGVAIQTDGRIVAAGITGSTGFGLARYNANGTLDPAFGGDGKVLTHFQFGGGANAVAIQANGKIVAAGTGSDFEGPFALARYKVNGQLDPTFGGDGKVTTRMGQGEESATSMAIQANGKIVVAGFTDVPHEFGDTFGPGKFALARYLASGALDTGFGDNGKVRTTFGRRDATANGVAIQSDGKLVAGGNGAGKFALARYKAHGALDGTFGGDGKVTTNFTSDFDGAGGVALQRNGKIVAAGTGGGFAVARYLGG